MTVQEAQRRKRARRAAKQRVGTPGEDVRRLRKRLRREGPLRAGVVQRELAAAIYAWIKRGHLTEEKEFVREYVATVDEGKRRCDEWLRANGVHGVVEESCP